MKVATLAIASATVSVCAQAGAGAERLSSSALRRAVRASSRGPRGVRRLALGSRRAPARKSGRPATRFHPR